MTDPAKNAPKLHLLAEAEMASPAASLATSQVLAVTANLAAMAIVMAAAKALHRVALDWAMQLSAPNALPWSPPKMRCAAWPRKPMARC
jgi:hypothetical protein